MANCLYIFSAEVSFRSLIVATWNNETTKVELEQSDL